MLENKYIFELEPQDPFAVIELEERYFLNEISNHLAVIKNFQSRFKTAHVGGSIGLALHGIDLKRPLTNSDIDMTVDDYITDDCDSSGYEKSEYMAKSSNDFDYQAASIKYPSIKIDIRVSPEPSFEVIKYSGVCYRVSKVRDILFWKRKYANKGSQKHIDDLKVIECGERPINSDKLPF